MAPAHAAQALIQFDNPLYSTSLNAPEGVNLMANTTGRWGPGPARPTATLLNRVAADGAAATTTTPTARMSSRICDIGARRSSC